MKKNNLTKLTSLISRLFDRDRFKIVFHPGRDWMILLAATAILLFLLSFFGYWVYAYFLDRESAEPAKPIKMIDLKKLEEVVKIFEAKEALFRKYYENPPRLPSPY